MEIKQVYAAIGKTIREHRKIKGLTLEELADKAGRDWSFLSQVERGKSVPSIETLALLCEKLEIPLAELFTEQKPQIYKRDGNTKKIISLVKDKPDKEKKRIITIIKQVLKK